ncbi:MAG: hypothetical protein ACRDJW_15950 [Thermomicrobiales bacterium]
MAGVRFLDSGRTYYFDPREIEVEVGDRVVVETVHGGEVGRVVIAPRQIRLNMLQGRLKPIERRLGPDDVEQLQRLKTEATQAETRLFGGLGRCGRTLGWTSRMPVDLDIAMSLAKARDLPLNPGKDSGVRGRLLSGFSYENEQYKQKKAVMPRLGQRVETPRGPGVVVSLQILKELVTVRLENDDRLHVFASAEVGFKRPAASTS